MIRAPAVSVESLRFTYRNGPRPALDGITLDFAERAWHLLLGPSGAGKSTLVRCLNGSIPHFYPGELSGRVAIAGRDVAASSVPEMASHLGVVYQDFESQIFSTSCFLEVAFAMENRCLSPEEIRRRVPALLGRVGLGGFEQRDPATLSGGEKQRLVIAAVLALEAPVLALDEPASDLDPTGREDIYRLVTQDETVLLVEHDLEGLPPARSGALLSQGCLRKRWQEGSVETVVDLVPDLREAGVRPPPIADLILHLREAARATGVEPPPPTALDPSGLSGFLQGQGWRLTRGAGRVSDSIPGGGLGAGGGTLRCENLSYTYPGRDRRAIDSVDVSFRAGEMIAIVGANGSGKTTLARLISGLLRPGAGRVLYDGEPVDAIPARRRAATIGYVFQNPDHQIFAATVKEEIEFGPRNIGVQLQEIERRVGSALEVVGLAGSEQADPFSMTKGERQRLALAAVLACEPELIVMDEPTTGLDLMQQEVVVALLERLNARGHTILIITHALWLVGGPVRRVLVMSDGRVIADGPPAELMPDDALMARAGLRVPDLARLARLTGTRMLTLGEWKEALEPPESFKET